MKTGWLITLALIGALAILPTSPVSATQTGNTTTYSIVHLSDTQNLATYYPTTYDYTFSYLESKRAQYNISAIIITGDLVNKWYKKAEWLAYAHAVNQTTIPLYVIAGNHDSDYGKNYTYYTAYTGNTAKNYVILVQDFDLVGINYAAKTLSSKDLLAIRNAITNTSHNFTIIATHFYLDKDGSISALGKDIDRQLVVKPTLVMGGHIHEDFIRTGLIGGIPVIEDLTNYQNGLPGSPVNKNYSAGTLYTVTALDGDVVKVSSRIIHIYPSRSVEAERALYDISGSATGASAHTVPLAGIVNQTGSVTITITGAGSQDCNDTLGVCNVPSIDSAGSRENQFWNFLKEIFRMP